jgi:hypothetical protein
VEAPEIRTAQGGDGGVVCQLTRTAHTAAGTCEARAAVLASKSWRGVRGCRITAGAGGAGAAAGMVQGTGRAAWQGAGRHCAHTGRRWGARPGHVQHAIWESLPVAACATCCQGLTAGEAVRRAQPLLRCQRWVGRGHSQCPQKGGDEQVVCTHGARGGLNPAAAAAAGQGHMGGQRALPGAGACRAVASAARRQRAPPGLWATQRGVRVAAGQIHAAATESAGRGEGAAKGVRQGQGRAGGARGRRRAGSAPPSEEAGRGASEGEAPPPHTRSRSSSGEEREGAQEWWWCGCHRGAWDGRGSLGRHQQRSSDGAWGPGPGARGQRPYPPTRVGLLRDGGYPAAPAPSCRCCARDCWSTASSSCTEPEPP